MVPPGSFHPSLKTRWGFVSIRCLGPALHPEAELEACRFQTSLHFSPEGRHAGACVFADRHASSRSVRLGACTLSWVLGLGRLASWQAAWEAGPSAPFCPVWCRETAILAGAGSAKSTAVMVAFSSGSTSNETGW